jgi:hypothetical protein
LVDDRALAGGDSLRGEPRARADLHQVVGVLVGLDVADLAVGAVTSGAGVVFVESAAGAVLSWFADAMAIPPAVRTTAVRMPRDSRARRRTVRESSMGLVSGTGTP